MKERIKQVRKSLPQKTTQTAFEEMLGTTRSAIATYELGTVVPSDTFLQLMCTKFNINEHWLKTGEGEMYAQTVDNTLAELTAQHGLTKEEQAAMRYFLRLDSDNRKNLLHHIRALAAELDSEPNTAP